MDALNRTLSRIRVLVADSSRIHTQLLSDILERAADFQVFSWDCNRSTLVPTLLRYDIQVLVISSTLSGSSNDCLDVVREMRAAKPDIKIVTLVNSYQHRLVLDYLRAGVRGIFSQESSLEMLRKCLQVVNRGEIWLDNRGMSLAVDALVSAPNLALVEDKALRNLSKRESEAMEWLVQGLSNKEISARMGLSPHTVKNYIFRIFEKMGVTSRAELLFLVLSQNHRQDAEISTSSDGQGEVRAFSALIEKAETGSSTAQLALAESYASLWQDNPDGAAQAYKWYLIVSDQIEQAKSLLAKQLSSAEVQECEKQVKGWTARAKHVAQSQLSSPLESKRRENGHLLAS
jgi:two-component system, NarL family, nitrate/nitrite response regulator NarL